MLIKNLRIENFRNFEFENVEFCDGLNIFHGKNGQGKTNLLEAVNYFTNGKSCKSNLRERDVIKFGQERCSLAAEFLIKGESVYEKIDLGTKKSIYINGSPVEKLSDILGLVNTVLFMPSDIEYVTGSPALRRDYIDSFLSKNKPGYFKLLSSYIYVMKQKNNILKSRQIADGQLDIYNEKLFEYGSKICEVRDKFIKVFDAYASHIYGQISENKEKISFIYKPCIEKYDSREEFLKEIESVMEKEIISGTSIKGAHRDDMTILINGKNARYFASQGQLRSIVLAMKTAESEIVNDTRGEYPIILLDDVLSELDTARREFLLSTLKDKQVIITLTNADVGKLNSHGKYFEIENGRIKK
ncbi:MAG: DNA replication/repair protein RecF [Ruminococcaceae bacterium]|nr:DNA replication/repair protein RecF [Oscillospiraceae bacterium]